MTKTVVFNGRNTLDFKDVRFNVLRIPEVSVRIKQAQEVWDAYYEKNFDFHGYLNSENRVFLSNIRLKILCAAVVQLGLYDRYRKLFGEPDFVIGNSNGYSALNVCIGKMTFEDMILKRNDKEHSPQSLEPVLAGISLIEYCIYKKSKGRRAYSDIYGPDMEIKNLVYKLIDNHQVKKIVNIGPGNVILGQSYEGLALSNVQLLESIDMDPMLSWFWPNIQRDQVAVCSAI